MLIRYPIGFSVLKYLQQNSNISYIAHADVSYNFYLEKRNIKYENSFRTMITLINFRADIIMQSYLYT